MQNLNAKHLPTTSASARKSMSKKAFAVSAALVLALSGGAATLCVTNAMASDAQPAAQTQVVFTWMGAATGADAARVVGLGRFEVPGRIELGDLVYENPTFSTAGNVAQATYETPATQLVVRKGNVNGHTAPLSDRKEAEFANKHEADVDGLRVTELGVDGEHATVLTWADGTVEYGVTWQGLGGDEMSMSTEDAARVVRSVRDANADPKPAQQQNQQQAAPQQKAAQQQGAPQQKEQPTSNMISAERAIAIATSYVAGDNNVSNVNCEFNQGSSAPRYTVTFHFDDADYVVKVGAEDGSVWYATTVYNDGTTRDFDSDEDEASYDEDEQNAYAQTPQQNYEENADYDAE